uniref:MIT_C domain-containing protein n=1 Tax=Ascaris lumbricoides TaxID=6252 RepID=A0A0M3HW28_ASCLU
IILSFIGQKSAKAEVEPGKTEQRSVADYYDADYWKEFLASQLDFLNVSSECADTESKDVVALKDASVECNSAVCDANTESADCHPSLSPAVSSCSESDSSAQSLSEPSPSKQKFVRRAPGSLRIEEVFSEAEARKSSKGYNVKLVKEIRIEDGSTGYGYDKLFVDALNSRLRSVFVNDPYIRLKSQAIEEWWAANFVVFCEVLMSNAPNLQKIILRTQNDPSVDHRALFSHLRWALFQNGIRLEIQRSETIHDREIRFDNGWIYRIGRGLDYFQKQPYLTVGLSNYNLRRCLETIVCITKEM